MAGTWLAFTFGHFYNALNEMRSILFLSVMNGGPWGGSEELWYQSALWTAQHGIPTAVCCFEWEKKKGRLQHLQAAGCTLYLLPGKDMTRKLDLMGNIRLSSLVAKVPFEQYDIVVVSQGGWKDVAHPPFNKLYERLREYILLYHNYNEQARFSKSKAQSMQAWVNEAKLNLGDTDKIFNALSAAYRIEIPNHQKLFNPLTFAIPSTPATFPGLVDGNYTFSVFAALDTERKAQDILVRTLAKEPWRSRNWKLNLYGEGNDKVMLQDLINKLGMNFRISLPGYATDYKQAIIDSHLVLQITHIDAMPITVMDALAIGRPVVASTVGDMPSWVKPGRNGWLTNHVTITDINDTMQMAWDQRDHWAKMGLESFEIFKTEFPKDPIDYFLRQTGIIR